MKLNEDNKIVIRALHQNGCSYSELAKVYGVSKRTIIYTCKTEEERKQENKAIAARSKVRLKQFPDLYKKKLAQTSASKRRNYVSKFSEK